MSDELRSILLEQVEKLLADRAGPDVLRRAEAGEWPEALWAEMEALGLPLALAPEEMGGAGLTWEDAVAVWQVLGRHGAPVPLAESMAAAGLLAAAGIGPPPGYLGLVVAGEPGLSWGRRAQHLVAAHGGKLVLCPAAKAQEGRDGFSRLPLDVCQPGPDSAAAPLPPALGAEAPLLAGAMIQAALIAGALEAVLDTAVDYANTRKQFGRPIGGFQAVQQLLAQAAGEVAAAGVAAAQAGRAASRRGLAAAEFEVASAKVVAGEAAGKVAAIVHQVHAAIGFTDEHHLHLFTRRLWAWRDACGTERVWAQRIGAAALARGGAALWPDLTARDEAAV
ncbi:acyl-CoA/acyl-ACP dehydrogenase [Siccirubricoccus sp. KC 17139]|uniref:Acyl-CoA/acyl-ACP dehydrogenase n=1 Tax=Siccirubricoccus soli TaxID=2899147 RepID=A0ABT1CY81_9PROT|nr:acyl-CoA dehydrogenase family protein [Siccirubricoccus soli]MCO6414619.1 acyl-CoA/acyl-ACP dehydrogenase [Siccirubricoccus soli]MCP2680749.1 acyl-CoA/acyl-ACP dehydrogenase [Siccirubricoccus soli]